MTRGGSQQFGRAASWGIALLMITAVLVGPGWAWAEDEMRGNQVFFRGGFAGLTSNRSGEVFTDAFGLSGRNAGSSGYYVGAGEDIMLTKDFWGMMNNISVVGEIGVEFKRFNSSKVVEAVPSTCAAAGIATCSVRSNTVQITMLTVDIAPKFKFNQFGNLVPWIIPIGLDFHVISPPSNASNYLDIGVQFAAGFEYKVWKELKLGADARFHLASNQTNTVNNFWTVGPYVGIGF
jgi:hypothetical protein